MSETSTSRAPTSETKMGSDVETIVTELQTQYGLLGGAGAADIKAWDPDYYRPLVELAVSAWRELGLPPTSSIREVGNYQRLITQAFLIRGNYRPLHLSATDFERLWRLDRLAERGFSRTQLAYLSLLLGNPTVFSKTPGLTLGQVMTELELYVQECKTSFMINLLGGKRWAIEYCIARPKESAGVLTFGPVGLQLNQTADGQIIQQYHFTSLGLATCPNKRCPDTWVPVLGRCSDGTVAWRRIQGDDDDTKLALTGAYLRHDHKAIWTELGRHPSRADISMEKRLTATARPRYMDLRTAQAKDGRNLYVVLVEQYTTAAAEQKLAQAAKEVADKMADELAALASATASIEGVARSVLGLEEEAQRARAAIMKHRRATEWQHAATLAEAAARSEVAQAAGAAPLAERKMASARYVMSGRSDGTEKDFRDLALLQSDMKRTSNKLWSTSKTGISTSKKMTQLEEKRLRILEGKMLPEDEETMESTSYFAFSEGHGRPVHMRISGEPAKWGYYRYYSRTAGSTDDGGDTEGALAHYNEVISQMGGDKVAMAPMQAAVPFFG